MKLRQRQCPPLLTTSSTAITNYRSGVLRGISFSGRPMTLLSTLRNDLLIDRNALEVSLRLEQLFESDRRHVCFAVRHGVRRERDVHIKLVALINKFDPSGFECFDD